MDSKLKCDFEIIRVLLERLVSEDRYSLDIIAEEELILTPGLGDKKGPRIQFSFFEGKLVGVGNVDEDFYEMLTSKEYAEITGNANVTVT
jgi:hypothetical protein